MPVFTSCYTSNQCRLAHGISARALIVKHSELLSAPSSLCTSNKCLRSRSVTSTQAANARAHLVTQATNARVLVPSHSHRQQLPILSSVICIGFGGSCQARLPGLPVCQARLPGLLIFVHCRGLKFSTPTLYSRLCSS